MTIQDEMQKWPTQPESSEFSAANPSGPYPYPVHEFFTFALSNSVSHDMSAKQKSSPKPTPNRPASASSKASPSPTRPPLTQTFAGSFWKDNWLPASLLMATAFGLYWASVAFGYVLDDEMVIQKNVFTNSGFGGIGRIFGADSFMGYFQKKESLYLLEGGRYRPLSLATFAVEIGLFGKDNPMLPHISHFVNILLYSLTGVLLYRILLGLFPLKEGGRWYFGLPFLAALIFAMHPLHVECVANIKGRDEILALLFSLGALYAMLKYFDTDRAIWQILSGTSLLLGLFAKENALTFLAVIPVTVMFFTPVSRGRALAASWPLMAAALIFIIVRFRALGFMLDHGKAVNDLMNDPFLGMTLGERLATTFLTLGWYLKLLVVPHPLTHDYYPYHVPQVGWSDWRALLALALYLGMGFWAVRNWQKRAVAAWCVVFFLLTLSIVSNLFVSVGTFMNERFVYMPSVAFCVLVAWLLARKVPELFRAGPDKPSILGVGILAVMVGFFGWRTLTRVPDWESERTLNPSAVQVSEGSARAHLFYVTALYKNDYAQAKTPEEKERLVALMEHHINRAVEINPKYGSAWQMKAGISAARFELDHQLDKLLHDFETIMERIPNNTDFRKFLDDYMVYLNGSNADKYMAFCHRVGYEYFFKKKGDAQNALKFLQYGLDRQYEDIRILDDMAEVYGSMGNQAKAAEMKARADAQR